VSDPVAWILIEPGWKVFDSGGKHVGHVEEVEGDPNADIFNGLLISTGLFGGKRYVPAEQIGLITEGGAHLTLTGDEVKRLSADSGPPGAA
jgi:sporulation protein YlmC with PRC-barrel domain